MRNLFRHFTAPAKAIKDQVVETVLSLYDPPPTALDLAATENDVETLKTARMVLEQFDATDAQIREGLEKAASLTLATHASLTEWLSALMISWPFPLDHLLPEVDRGVSPVVAALRREYNLGDYDDEIE